MRGRNHQKWVVAGGLGALQMVFRATWPKIWFFFGLGMSLANSYNFWFWGAFWGRFGDILWSQRALKGLSARGSRAACVEYPLFPFIWPLLAGSRVVLGKKRLILALNCRF